MNDSSVTELLALVRQGESGAHEALVERVHGELRRLASAQISRHSPRSPLQPTELVHEAYLRLVAVDDPCFESRQQFYGLVACIMRGLLADLSRKRRSQKRGGDRRRDDLELDEFPAARSGEVELMDVAAAIEALARVDQDLAHAAELRYLMGLSVNEMSATLGASIRTVERRVSTATAWLRQRLRDDER